MQQYNIEFSKEFEEDINNIFKFISQDNEFYAESVFSNIMSHCTGILSIMPYMGVEIDRTTQVRKTVEKQFNYKILYTVIEESLTIRILSVSKSKT